MTKRLLIGGSPCTHWSIAKTKNRETRPEGIGWELFKNYLIALEKFKPDYFLYENNKSMASAIREQITKELGVEPVCINSALVSAQNRQRLYWVGKRNPDDTYSTVQIEQPEDRGILLLDIIEGGICDEKTYALAEPLRTTSDGKPRNMIAEPVRIGTIESAAKNVGYDSQQYRVYSPDGKSVTLCGQGGGIGAKTGLYAVPFNLAMNKSVYPVYEVRGGTITIKNEQYQVKLADGYYIIRKLTVQECMRLQTVPEWYKFPVSNSQAYKLLGNGWTVDVITHILSYCDGISHGIPLTALSMYDGMSCGNLALQSILGWENYKYYATEIDKYAIKTTQHNFPGTIQLGDAFQVRDEGWKLPKEAYAEAA